MILELSVQRLVQEVCNSNVPMSGFVPSNAHQLPSDPKSHLPSEPTLPPKLTSSAEPELR